MAEGRIAEVVAEACSRHNVADVGEFVAQRRVGIFIREADGNLVAERATHARHLEAMGEAVVDKDAPRKRKHLGLVLQSAERGGEYQTVVIALKIRARVMALIMEFLHAEASVADQFFPIHSSHIFRHSVCH